MNKVTKKELVERVNEQELRIYRIEKALKQNGVKWTANDKPELTGSDLCRAMLERGDKFILCSVDDCSDDEAINDLEVQVVGGTQFSDFISQENNWKYAVPINNQGEPLTATDVGL